PMSLTRMSGCHCSTCSNASSALAADMTSAPEDRSTMRMSSRASASSSTTRTRRPLRTAGLTISRSSGRRAGSGSSAPTRVAVKGRSTVYGGSLIRAQAAQFTSRARSAGHGFVASNGGHMNRDTLKGQWTQLKGQVRKQWGKLTEDEVDQIQGDSEILMGKLQQRYGYTREQAQREI